jgi:hypothetical protein
MDATASRFLQVMLKIPRISAGGCVVVDEMQL